MTKPLSRRLSPQDAAFLYFERRDAPLHIGSLGIYEGRIPFERFVNHINSRLAAIPRYRQRLAPVPFDLDQPTWEDDPQFDIKRHIHQAMLPSPGTEAQLRELSSQLFEEPLDRNKPLWEMHLIYGLDQDKTAILSKVHHCLVDGVSGIELLLAVVDLTPEPAPPPEAPPWDPPPLPGPLARLSQAVSSRVAQQRDIFDELRDSFLHPLDNIERAREMTGSLGPLGSWLVQPAPRTAFNVRVSKRRRTAWSDVSFTEIRQIRTSLGGTVNDVVLAVVSGALHRYLKRRGERVDGGELRIAVPVNVRVEEEEGALGNRVSCIVTTLPVGEANTARQLELVRDRMEGIKRSNQALSIERLMRYAGFAPVALQRMMGWGAEGRSPVNLICTNVPGPMIPLYSVGHLLLAHYPLVPLTFDMGLAVGVTSYNQRLFFGLMADPAAIPDVEMLKRCLDEAFLELRGAAGVEVSDLPAFVGAGMYTLTAPQRQAG